MKIAFLFMFYNDHCQDDYMQNFFKQSSGDHNIYCHFKKNDGYKKSYHFGQFSIPKHIETRHCDINLVDCYINLLETALLKNENQWFIFLSGSCLPIKTFLNLYDFLKKNTLSFFNTLCHADREEFHPKMLQGWIGEWNDSYVNYDFSKFKKHSQWCILNRKDAEILVKTRDKHLPAWRALQDKYKRGFAKDEFYPLAVLNHENYNYVYNEYPTTYVKWKKGKTKPETFMTLNSKTLEHCPSSFFIRKVDTHTEINLEN